MKHILLNKAFALGAITLALASCGESDGNQKLYPEGLAAPTFNGDMVIEISENQEPLTIDLLGDVNNPEDSALFARKLTYLRVELDEDGLPVNVDAEGNVVAAGTGQEVPLWEGPTLPSGTVVQTSNSITIDVSELRPFLVPQHTLDTYPNPVVVGQPDGVDNEENNDFDRYLQGVYRYTYIIDNGSADPVERNIILKVNADTVDAESINLVTDSNIEVPKGYGVNIVATVEPSAFYGAGATFANVIYTSLNPEIATVNELGLVTGVEFGTFEIKLTSQDGLVETTVTGEVVPLTEPVGVVIVADNEVPQQQIFDRYQVALDGTLDIDHTFLPAEVDFPDATVTWSSMDESKVMVDGDGLLMPVTYNNDFDREDDASMVNVTEVMVAVEDNPSLNFSVEVEIVPGADLFASGNPSFDDGLDQTKFNIRDPAKYGSQQNAAETIEVREGDDTIDGKSLFIDNTAGAARMTILANATSQSGVKPGDYNLMFDYKVLSGVLNVAMAPNGGNWRPWPNWGQSKPAGDQGTATVKIENYLIGNDGKFHIIFNIDQIEGQGGTHYLDNFRLVPIE